MFSVLLVIPAEEPESSRIKNRLEADIISLDTGIRKYNNLILLSSPLWLIE